MNILTILERAETKISTVFNVALKAQRSLSYDAERALERWLSFNWTEGNLSKDFQNGRGGIFAEIYEAGEPVREEIRKVYGDSVLLYRGMKNESPGGKYDTSDNRLYSWTFDEKVAQGYAYRNRMWNYKPLSAAEVDKLVARYEEVGYVRYSGRYYKRSAIDPDYYDIYDRHRQHITDGNDIREEIEGNERDRAEMEQHKKDHGSVSAKQIPVKDIVWLATTSEKEVIVIGHSS